MLYVVVLFVLIVDVFWFVLVIVRVVFVFVFCYVCVFVCFWFLEKFFELMCGFCVGIEGLLGSNGWVVWGMSIGCEEFEVFWWGVYFFFLIV